MKILYFDCPMGAAGDMIVASLIELLPNPESFIQRFNQLGIGDAHLGNIQLNAEKCIRCGILGTHVQMKLQQADSEHWVEETADCVSDASHDHEHCHHDHEHCHHDHEHCHCDHGHCHCDHEHGHHGHHHGMTMYDISFILYHLDISSHVRDNVLSVFNRIAEAESQAHGCPVEQVHFHEVGQLDALADILAACMIIDEIAPDKVYCSPLCVGFGHVHCAHGILPVPAPATINILKGVPVYAGHIGKEMTTPTGAAIITHFTDKYCTMPQCIIHQTGLGMGTRDFDSAPNMIRAMICDLGCDDNHIVQNNTEKLVELRSNIDDMTPEQLAFAADLLLNAGARDVWTTPIVMKKGRSAVMLSCLVDAGEQDKYIQLMLKHTSSLGVRMIPCYRTSLEREAHSVETELGTVRIKHASNAEISRRKWEFEDIAEIARKFGLSIETVLSRLKMNDES